MQYPTSVQLVKRPFDAGYREHDSKFPGLVSFVTTKMLSDIGGSQSFLGNDLEHTSAPVTAPGAVVAKAIEKNLENHGSRRPLSDLDAEFIGALRGRDRIFFVFYKQNSAHIIGGIRVGWPHIQTDGGDLFLVNHRETEMEVSAIRVRRALDCDMREWLVKLSNIRLHL